MNDYVFDCTKQLLNDLKSDSPELFILFSKYVKKFGLKITSEGLSDEGVPLYSFAVYDYYDKYMTKRIFEDLDLLLQEVEIVILDKVFEHKNKNFITLGASNHTNKERETSDYYATDPKAIDILVAHEKFNNQIWEPACGAGHLSEQLIHYGYSVYSTDLVDRGYGNKTGIDFLEIIPNELEIFQHKFDIITNPPYKHAQQFIEKALDLVLTGCKVAMFLKIQYLEGQKRKKLFLENPPKRIYVTSSRITCAKNGDFAAMKKSGGGALAYAWFIWEKGYEGDTILKWIN